ncbi:MAG: nucleoside 2-deoxyribosyltransferase [Candidatus Saccharibacteria bacterium]
MKVHFITAKPNLENEIDVLRHIISVITENDHTLAHPWIEDAYKNEIEAGKSVDNWSEIYKKNLAAIAQADVVIAETSYENFAVGYQIAMAIQQKKPVLLLRHANADKETFITGVEDGWVQHGEYEDFDQLAGIVRKFLEDNDIKSKDMRFNFFIDRKIYNYLRWAAFKTGKTKAEILRDLVEREIRKQDY